MKFEIKTACLVSGIAAAALLSGCRGQTSNQPPLWIKHGMEYQNKWVAFQKNSFYNDGRNMRTPPEGTVAAGLLMEDDGYWRGGTDTAHYIANPLKITMGLLDRGQQRFNIYCAPCHGSTGMAEGIMVQRGFLRPPSFHEDRLVNMPDGQIFFTITGGIRKMPAYARQIPEEDRWAIVAYMRALQRSQRATLNDVPDAERANLK